MNRATCSTFGLALLLEACAVSGADVSPSDVARNTCQQNSDCPGGAACNVSDKICQGSRGEIASLLIAVTPPPTLVGVSSFTYFTEQPDDSTSLTGSSGGMELDLAPALSVSGGVHAATAGDCTVAWFDPQLGSFTTADGTMPASVVFTPSQRAYGVPTDNYSVGPTITTDPSDKHHRPVGYGFTQSLPGGKYDVYIKPAYPLVPPLDTMTSCQVPPRLLLNQTAASNFDFKLPPPSTLTINVTWPLAAQYADGADQTDVFLGNPLVGWTLDLVDQSSGRVLSTVQTLDAPMSPPVVGDMKVTYQKTLVYAPVYALGQGGEPEPINVGTEIIRLTPPAYDVRFGPDVPYAAPTILAQLDGALVDADGKPAPAQIVQTSPLPTPVTVQFQTGLGDSTPIPAGVLITAEELDGISGLSTSFSRTIQVGADGTASVDLLPGKYRVIASPQSGCSNGSCLGLVETEWMVRATPPSQAGKYIVFDQAPSYDGNVTTPAGAAATGVTVHAVASALFSDPNVLNVGDATVAVVPRATSALVGSSGSFSLQADPGLFDLRVEPDPSTGFGWLVKPGFELPARAEELGNLELQLPIVYRGSANFLGGDGTLSPIPKALIRAYVYVKDGKLAKAEAGAVALQVAETYAEDQAGDAGAFRLLIPKELEFPPPASEP